MHNLTVERLSLRGKPLSYSLATHIRERARFGKIAVVTARPACLLPSLRKQWAHLIRNLQIERARTLQVGRIHELNEELSRMQNLTFTAKSPDDVLEADVSIATVNSFLKVAPMCPTMFVACKLTNLELHMVTSWMPPNAIVTIYEQD